MCCLIHAKRLHLMDWLRSKVPSRFNFRVGLCRLGGGDTWLVPNDPASGSWQSQLPDSVSEDLSEGSPLPIAPVASK